MKSLKEVCQKCSYNATTRYVFMVFSRETWNSWETSKFLGVFKRTVKSHKTYTTQPASSIVFKCFF